MTFVWIFLLDVRLIMQLLNEEMWRDIDARGKSSFEINYGTYRVSSRSLMSFARKADTRKDNRAERKLE